MLLAGAALLALGAGLVWLFPYRKVYQEWWEPSRSLMMDDVGYFVRLLPTAGEPWPQNMTRPWRFRLSAVAYSTNVPLRVEITSAILSTGHTNHVLISNRTQTIAFENAVPETVKRPRARSYFGPMISPEYRAVRLSLSWRTVFASKTNGYSGAVVGFRPKPWSRRGFSFRPMEESRETQRGLLRSLFGPSGRPLTGQVLSAELR
jgi:hypothetical protein